MPVHTTCTVREPECSLAYRPSASHHQKTKLTVSSEYVAQEQDRQAKDPLTRTPIIVQQLCKSPRIIIKLWCQVPARIYNNKPETLPYQQRQREALYGCNVFNPNLHVNHLQHRNCNQSQSFRRKKSKSEGSDVGFSDTVIQDFTLPVCLYHMLSSLISTKFVQD